ncbi:uncharacterized protein LOC112454362 [Temnothorax curvispinosus]|uniref:Uncharacterized protein LOC112454362 n=1 Tax=Temnothorax curvispinosus TaxID=300111 RepID=A0A6J1PP35_9HYME|nr:uncharacterized protein LOC112454362 [Temnothorax curvispinosus]
MKITVVFMVLAVVCATAQQSGSNGVLPSGIPIPLNNQPKNLLKSMMNPFGTYWNPWGIPTGYPLPWFQSLQQPTTTPGSIPPTSGSADINAPSAPSAQSPFGIIRSIGQRSSLWKPWFQSLQQPGLTPGSIPPTSGSADISAPSAPSAPNAPNAPNA